MSRAEITEERLKLTASQSRCRLITNHTILCISARTAAEHTNVCCAVTKGYAYAYLCPLIHRREECSVMPGRKSIELSEEEEKHKELDLTVMNGARLGVIMRLMLPDTSCEDCLLAIFSFLSERHWCATEISQTHTKHLCHIINLSQSFLCNTKDTSSSVLISVAYSVFLLHRQRLHRDCSSGELFCVRANQVILMRFSCPECFFFVQLGKLLLKQFFSPSLSFCLSFSAHINKRACVLAPNIHFARMTAAYISIAHHHPSDTADLAPLTFPDFLMLSANCFHAVDSSPVFAHNWLLSCPYLFEQPFGSMCGWGLYSGCWI